ncbi:hypothetical protein [Algibacter sp.]|uniref:hypothetical protein n=1 Tax=Algibacter sp. TaxID=1872428 RepID=UPI003C70FC84
MKKTLTYLLILIFIISCKTDDGVPDCSAVLCAAPAITINLIDDTTNENIIIQDNISEESIVIKNNLENEVEFHIFESNSMLYVNRQNQTDTLEIQIDSEIVATISYDTAKPQTEECCDIGILKNVTVEGLYHVVENNLITIYL